jgi:hypothetical protein
MTPPCTHAPQRKAGRAQGAPSVTGGSGDGESGPSRVPPLLPPRQAVTPITLRHERRVPC